MDKGYRIVYFGKYCKDCKHADAKEEEEPCAECLDNPVNLYSNKPTKFEEKEKRNAKS